MQKNIYVKNAALLTTTSFALRAVGMFFRIYIAALIGASGMGVFQLIATVYALSITFATAGLSVVSTRVIAEQMVQNKSYVRSCMRKILQLGLVLGILCCAVLLLASPFIGEHLLRDKTTILPLQILSFSLPFMASSSILRGYFLAVKRVGPNVRSQIFEQIVRIILVVALLYYFNGADVTKSIIALVVGSTVSEALSWCYMYYCYKKSVRDLPYDKKSVLTTPISRILVPIAAAQYSTGTLKAAENIIVPICLALFLGSRDLAVQQFGALKGMAIPVLFFPFSFIGTLATLLLPDISAAHVRGQKEVLQRLISRVLILTLSVSIMAGGVYTVFSDEIALILYNDREIGFYLQVLGPLAPFMYLESMVDGILKGMNEQVATFKYTLLDCTIRLALIFILLPSMGMQGFLLIMLISNMLTCLLNLRKLLQVTGLKIMWRQWLIGPCLAVSISGLTYYLMQSTQILAAFNLTISTIIGLIIFSACYILIMPALSGVNYLIMFKK